MTYSGTILAAAIIAQTAIADPALNPNWWQPIVNTGAIGGVLIWFMFRMEKRMNESARAQNLMTQMIGAAVLDSKHKDQALSELVTKLKDQADDALKQHGTTTTPG